MDFIESLFGIENRWAVLAILVGIQIILCIIVCKTAKKPLWCWLTYVLSALFIVVYIWKFSWLFILVGILFAFGPAQLIVSMMAPASTRPSHTPTVPRDPYHPVSSTIANLSPRSKSFYDSLRGKTVYHPLLEKLYIYVGFLCVDILGVEPSAVSMSSDFNEDFGADSSDFSTFARHIAEEIYVPKAYVGKLKDWLNEKLAQANINETNETYKFPVNTVRDMVNALLAVIPERIEYPK